MRVSLVCIIIILIDLLGLIVLAVTCITLSIIPVINSANYSSEADPRFFKIAGRCAFAILLFGYSFNVPVAGLRSLIVWTVCTVLGQMYGVRCRRVQRR
jgi:hypothetical protein